MHKSAAIPARAFGDNYSSDDSDPDNSLTVQIDGMKQNSDGTFTISGVKLVHLQSFGVMAQEMKEKGYSNREVDEYMDAFMELFTQKELTKVLISRVVVRY